MREATENKVNLDKLLKEGRVSRAKTKSGDYSVVLPQTVFRERWTEPINRVKAGAGDVNRFDPVF